MRNSAIAAVALVLGLSASVDAAPPVNPDTTSSPNYFTQKMIDEVKPPGLVVWRSASMPANDSVLPSEYPYYPASIVFSPSIAKSSKSTAALTKFAWLPWGNRCDLCADSPNRKPNGLGGPGFRISTGAMARMSYTTRSIADNVTIAQTLYAFGYPAHAPHQCPVGMTYCGYLDASRAAGIPDRQVISYATAAANPDLYFTVPNGIYMTAINWIILPDGILPSKNKAIYGALCDCEFQDNRTASSTTALIAQLALIAHNAGYKFAVSADDYFGGGITSGFCGVGIKRPNCDAANLSTIANIVDALMVAASRPPPRGYTFESALSAHLALFGPRSGYPPNRLHLQLTLGKWPDGTSIADAQAARAFILANGFGGVSFAPIGAPVGGGLCRHTNLKIAILLGLPTGDCR